MMMRIREWLLVVVVTWASLACAEAPPLTVTNEVFADHMVLQRDRDLTIPGTAVPGATVTVRLGDREVKTVADATGYWKATLPAMPAGGPFVLEIRSGDQTLRFKDVLLGEVWVCSGQSNMWWPVGKSRDAEKEVAAASYPQIRLLMVKPAASPNARPTDHLVKERDWTPCSPKTAADFSGLAYYFGRQLHRELKVPVGLIQCASCGTQIQPFIRLETLLGTRHAWGANNVKKFIDKYDKQQAALDAWEAADPATRGAKPAGPKPMTNHKSTSALYCGSIAPMRHHAIRGVIWFQGESNAYGSRSYADLFVMMIRDWRDLWGDEKMPFLFGQLSGVRRKQTDPNEESGFISVREAQDAALKLPMTGMAVAADVSTGDVHFRDKQTVGGRLAQTAMGMVYGKDVLTSGPRLKSVRFEKGKAILTFDHVGDKLVVRGPRITGFALAGSDGTFHWADATLNADQSITLESAAVPEPVAVRHGWGSAPPINVFNSGGLPMVPFRTDTWVRGKKPTPKAAPPKPPASTPSSTRSKTAPTDTVYTGPARIDVRALSTDVSLRPGKATPGATFDQSLERWSKKPQKYALTCTLPVTDEWREMAFSFIPSTNARVRLRLRGENNKKADGWVCFDAVRIQGAELLNGDFETGTTRPEDWVLYPQLGAGFDDDSRRAKSGRRFVTVCYDLPAMQTIKVRAGKEVRITVWTRAVEGASPVAEAPGGRKRRYIADIRQFRKNDVGNPPKPHPILFVGSSSMMGWRTVGKDMAPLNVLNRGFGGSMMEDVLHHMDTIVIPYKPRAVVVYEGDNDSYAKVAPEVFLTQCKQFVQRLEKACPGIPVYFLAVKPSPRRRSLWPAASKMNELLKQWCDQTDGLTYIDIATPMLDAKGAVRTDIFKPDRLHMNAAGYTIWKDTVRPILLKDFPVADSPQPTGTGATEG